MLRRYINKLNDRKREDGFTLIELVIVVVIIGILTAIAIPSYGAIQQTARTNAVHSATTDMFSAINAKIAAGDTVKGGTYTQDSHIVLRVDGTNGPASNDCEGGGTCITPKENSFSVTGYWYGKPGDSSSMDRKAYRNEYVGFVSYTDANGKQVNRVDRATSDYLPDESDGE